ncbi:MAG: helix-turn-helix domain-containing protein [Acidobacteriota bacterium]|nr:helix-turn-helix domain-containing protein [Acidobacteriota bacterium]
MTSERENAISPRQAEEVRAFWREIPALRREAHVTQRAVAERLGTTQPMVSLLESDGLPDGSDSRLVRYVEALTGWAEPLANAPTRFEQHAKQLERTPDLPGGDIFVAHIEDVQPKVLPSEEEQKRELWQQLVQGRKAASVSQTVFARRIGIGAPDLSRLEKRGAAGYRIKTLKRYLGALEDWAEPMREAATLSPIQLAERKRERFNQRMRESQKRWRDQNPERAREMSRRTSLKYARSEKGNAKQREYERSHRQGVGHE